MEKGSDVAAEILRGEEGDAADTGAFVEAGGGGHRENSLDLCGGRTFSQR